MVTGKAHEAPSASSCPGVQRVVAEPSPRDSMAAIGLAAAQLEREDPDALVASFAADHVITDPEEFRTAVREAAAVADAGWLATIGIEPTAPATGFGYIRAGEPLDGFPTALDGARVRREAGPRAGAGVRRVGGVPLERRHVRRRAHPCCWTCWPSSTPTWPPACARSRRTPRSLEERWPQLTKIAIDHAVAEPAAAAGRVATVPGSFGWEDVGDFASLAALTGPGEGFRVLGDPDLVLGQDATGLVVPAGGRTVAVVGLDDVVVVDTGDALLVTTSLDRAQDVKAVVDAPQGRRTPGPDLT